MQIYGITRMRTVNCYSRKPRALTHQQHQNHHQHYEQHQQDGPLFVA